MAKYKCSECGTITGFGWTDKKRYMEYCRNPNCKGHAVKVLHHRMSEIELKEHYDDPLRRIFRSIGI